MNAKYFRLVFVRHVARICGTVLSPQQRHQSLSKATKRGADLCVGHRISRVVNNTQQTKRQRTGEKYNVKKQRHQSLSKATKRSADLCVGHRISRVVNNTQQTKRQRTGEKYNVKRVHN